MRADSTLAHAGSLFPPTLLNPAATLPPSPNPCCAGAQVDRNDRPLEDIKILNITVSEAPPDAAD